MIQKKKSNTCAACPSLIVARVGCRAIVAIVAAANACRRNGVSRTITAILCCLKKYMTKEGGGGGGKGGGIQKMKASRVSGNVDVSSLPCTFIFLQVYKNYRTYFGRKQTFLCFYEPTHSGYVGPLIQAPPPEKPGLQLHSVLVI